MPENPRVECPDVTCGWDGGASQAQRAREEIRAYLDAMEAEDAGQGRLV